MVLGRPRRRQVLGRRRVVKGSVFLMGRRCAVAVMSMMMLLLLLLLLVMLLMELVRPWRVVVARPATMAVVRPKVHRDGGSVASRRLC